MKHRRRNHRGYRRVEHDQFAEPVEERPDHLDSHASSILLTDVGQRPLDLPAEVSGDPIGRLGSSTRTLFGRDGVSEWYEARLQPLGDEDFVEPGGQFLHDPNARSSSLPVPGSLL